MIPQQNVLDLVSLDGKVGVVSGAASGIGLGIATRLAEAGAEPGAAFGATFGQFLAEDSAKWAKIIKASGAKLD